MLRVSIRYCAKRKTWDTIPKLRICRCPEVAFQVAELYDSLFSWSGKYQKLQMSPFKKRPKHYRFFIVLKVLFYECYFKLFVQFVSFDNKN